MYLLLVLHIAQQSKTVSQYRTPKKPPPPLSLFTTYTFLPSLWAIVLLKSGPAMHARMLQFLDSHSDESPYHFVYQMVCFQNLKFSFSVI